MTEQAKVITIAERTTKQLSTAASQLAALMTSSSETLPALLMQIEEKQSEFNALEVEVENKARLAKVELDIKIKENEKEVLASIMEKLGLAEISKQDLAILQSNLEKAKKDNSETIAAAVEQAEKAMAAAHELETLKLKSEHDKAQAEAKSKTDAAEAKVKFLEESLQQARETIAAEREARVNVAQHAATEAAARSAVQTPASR